MSNWQEYTDFYHSKPHTVTGNLRVYPGVYSPQLDNKRDIVVYLPPSYEIEPSRHYPVLYMHDGQNLFDEHMSFSGEWCVDETMEQLAKEGLEAIVVGIPNMGLRRLAEYSPFRDAMLGGGQGDLYLSFIIDTLKPMIDDEGRTLKDPPHTGILGSSMGGLISLYAFFHRPDVFGFSGAMSPSIWYARGAILKHIPQLNGSNGGRIYLDVGTKEFSDYEDSDARSEHYADRIRNLRTLLVECGYPEGDRLKYVEEKGARHREAAWRRRLAGAIRFYLS